MSSSLIEVGPQVKRIMPSQRIRRMRGQTQSQLLETASGHAYVTKFQSNPLGPRVLASEWIGAHLMQHIGLPVPDIALIEVRSLVKDVTQGNPGIPAGLHFGSEYPGDPSSVAVYDFIPDRLLPLIENQDNFAGAFVFDMWVANADFRQAIFYRCGHDRRRFSVRFIDNSHLFGGPEWKFEETGNTGMHMFRTLYGHIRNWDNLSPWLERIAQTGYHYIVEGITSSVPEQWVTQNDWPELERVTEQLEIRSRSLRERVDAYIQSFPEQFPHWNLPASSGTIT